MSDKPGLMQRFFYDFTISRAKLDLLRIVFFGLVGLDAFLQIEHAPRYGAGDFNVAHFAFLDALLPLPGREAMMVLYIVQAYLGFRVMAGVTVRWSLAILTALYGFTYFISQVDSYQHHYLVFLLLFLFNFFPWDAARDTEDPRALLPGWAVRLLMCQVSVLYLWTAIAKMDPVWIDGRTFRMQLTDPFFLSMLKSVSSSLGMELLTLFSVVSVAVMVGELALSVAIHIRRLWPFLVPVGAAFHMGIEFSGFKIGLFSYFMVALYILVIPERWMVAPARWLAGGEEVTPQPKRSKKKRKGREEPEEEGQEAPAAPVARIPGGSWEMWKGLGIVLLLVGVGSQIRPLRNLEWMAALAGGTFLLMLALQYYPGHWLDAWSLRLGARLGIQGDQQRTWAFLAAAVVVGSGVLWVMPFAEAPWYVAAIATLGLTLDVGGGRGRMQRAVAHLFVCGLLLLCHATTDQALDYYRYMGGDARRRGELDTAIRAYTQVTVVDPSYVAGYRRLGDLYMMSRDYPRAVDAYREGAERAPSDPAYLLPLARALSAAKQGDEAVEVAKRLSALRLGADAEKEVQRILRQWSGGGGGEPGEDPGPAPEPGDDEAEER